MTPVISAAYTPTVRICIPMTTQVESKEGISLMAHLIRRAGFGASRDEIERRVSVGYDETVEELLDYDRNPPIDEYLLYRYFPRMEIPAGGPAVIEGQANWLYRMRVTERPLEEKMTLFWHHVFRNGPQQGRQLLRAANPAQHLPRARHGQLQGPAHRACSGPGDDLLARQQREPQARAQRDTGAGSCVELFSMGVGGYTEADVFECARAFTGWTIEAKLPRNPYGREPWHFEYRAEDHDSGSKSFLGHVGDLNGEDVVDVILAQPACPMFIARHLYNFFVADEPPVPSWPVQPPQDPDAVTFLAAKLVESGFELKPVMRALFTSDFFKNAMYRKVRSPIEVVVGTLKLVGEFGEPVPRPHTDGRDTGVCGPREP